MRLLFLGLCAILISGKNIVAAQSDSTSVTMNTFMAKNPGGNASLANVSMWPNPARGSVNIYINSIRTGDRGQCVMYNSNGTACAVTNLSNGTNKVYFSSLPEGIYYLNIRLHNDIIFSKRLFVER
jgi:hypothetical protein